MLAEVMSVSSDHLIRAIARGANVRVAAIITTSLVADAARRHELSPAATIALGRGLTAGLLLATLTKGEERVTVQLTSDGPIGTITVDANGGGDVRGYVGKPKVELDLGAGRPKLAPLVGTNGIVNVLRDLGLKELYQGQTPLVSGEIDEDVEAYLRKSEQVPSAMACDVLIDDKGQVIVAAGVLVQAMPDGDPEAVRAAEQILRSGKLYELLAAGERSSRVLAETTAGLGALEFVGEDRPVRFQCRCTPERIASVLQLLGTVDLDEMIAENKPAEVVCNYCNTRYQFGKSELERLRAEAAGRARENN